MVKDLYDLDKVIHFHALTAKNHYKTNIGLDELKQVAMEGYLKSKLKFKVEYGKLSLNYASSYIRNELDLFIKKEHNFRNRMLTMEDNITEDESEEESNLTSLNILKVLTNYLKELPEKEAYIVRNYYLAEEPMRLTDISKILNLTKQRVHQIKEKGKNNLKALLLRDNVQLEESELRILRGEDL